MIFSERAPPADAADAVRDAPLYPVLQHEPGATDATDATDTSGTTDATGASATDALTHDVRTKRSSGQDWERAPKQSSVGRRVKTGDTILNIRGAVRDAIGDAGAAPGPRASSRLDTFVIRPAHAPQARKPQHDQPAPPLHANVVKSERELLVEAHARARIECDVSNSSDVRWYKDGELVAGGAGVAPGGEGVWRDHAALVVGRATRGDAAAWRCTYTDRNGKTVSGKPTKLLIYEPVRSVYLAVDGRRLDAGNTWVPVRDKTELEVRCVAEGGVPPPELSWRLLALEPALDHRPYLRIHHTNYSIGRNSRNLGTLLDRNAIPSVLTASLILGSLPCRPNVVYYCQRPWKLLANVVVGAEGVSVSQAVVTAARELHNATLHVARARRAGEAQLWRPTRRGGVAQLVAAITTRSRDVLLKYLCVADLLPKSFMVPLSFTFWIVARAVTSERAPPADAADAVRDAPLYPVLQHEPGATDATDATDTSGTTDATGASATDALTHDVRTKRSSGQDWERAPKQSSVGRRVKTGDTILNIRGAVRDAIGDAGAAPGPRASSRLDTFVIRPAHAPQARKPQHDQPAPPLHANVVKSERELLVEAHARARIECDVSNSSDVRWYKDGELVAGGAGVAPGGEGVWRDHAALVVGRATRGDAAAWRCTYTDRNGKTVSGKPTKLLIYEPVRSVYLAVDGRRLDAGNTWVPVRDKTELEVRCVAEGGVPPPELSWRLLALEPALDHRPYLRIHHTNYSIGERSQTYTL
uniref:Ig-like domain-containing protein n=1 Tax=Heliothis virescens TaxID=7102 RepID=A0A2A4J3W1_HELVI